jgi:hypothetical protein
MRLLRYCVSNNMQQQLTIAPDEAALKDKNAQPWSKNPSVNLFSCALRRGFAD